MGAPRKSGSPEFSADDVTKFMTWLAAQDEAIRDVFKLSPSSAVRAMRNQRRGLDPLEGGGGRVRSLYRV